MRIVIITTWYSERMGYIENCLPKAMAKLGHEVHIVSSTAQVYYNSPDYKEVYEPFIGKNIQEVGVKEIDGITLHRIPFKDIGNKVLFKNLGSKLKEINPDVVQVFEAFSITTLQAAYYKIILGYQFFTANHTVNSVFPLYQDGQGGLVPRFIFFITRTVPGTMISWITSRCYPATVDALDLAVKYYGVPKRKAQLASLGVDTGFFCPIDKPEERAALRAELGFTDEDIVCIYTGRFTEGKNPLVLAQAIHHLNEKGETFRGLFMGNGPQFDEIKKMKGCVVHKFVPYHELPKYYALAEVGIWPRQESTSMIDAAACGLPIIISDRVLAIERVEGNGLTYIENDRLDLANNIMKMKDKALRHKLGSFGVEKIQKNYSWDKIAKERIADFEMFIK
jgi:glycosyltransferase involved in cell wall biosynthesis